MHRKQNWFFFFNFNIKFRGCSLRKSWKNANFWLIFFFTTEEEKKEEFLKLWFSGNFLNVLDLFRMNRYLGGWLQSPAGGKSEIGYSDAARRCQHHWPLIRSLLWSAQSTLTVLPSCNCSWRLSLKWNPIGAFVGFPPMQSPVRARDWLTS